MHDLGNQEESKTPMEWYFKRYTYWEPNTIYKSVHLRGGSVKGIKFNVIRLFRYSRSTLHNTRPKHRKLSLIKGGREGGWGVS